jgi:hypothetical protein
MGEYDHGKTKLAVKGAVLFFTLLLAVLKPDVLSSFFTYPIFFANVFHIIWVLTVLVLLRRFVPQLNKKVSTGKIFEKNYVKVGKPAPSKQVKLIAYTRKLDRGAVKSALYWTLVIVAMGLVYRLGLLNKAGLFVMVIFFIFMDQFCVTVWCPFKWLIRNKCCKTCRINNWGYFMALSPLIWLPSFWTYSVLFLSAAVIGQWEMLFRKHPERFYEGYNAILVCKNCTTKCSRRLPEATPA